MSSRCAGAGGAVHDEQHTLKDCFTAHAMLLYQATTPSFRSNHDPNLSPSRPNPRFAPLAQALAALFMMNNAHFMVKTVEGSEALMLLGPDWLERQKDKVGAGRLVLNPDSSLA